MNTRQRIKRLEEAKTNTGAARVVVWWDSEYMDGLATFDDVRMTPEEAEAKAAALPESVLVIHVVYADMAETEHAQP